MTSALPSLPQSALTLCFCLTSLALFKRSFSLGSLHEFELEFGEGLITPKFYLFTLISALALCSSLNQKVITHYYLEVTGYYEELKRQREFMAAQAEFMAALKKEPVKHLLVSTPDDVSKYLAIPMWLVQRLHTVYKYTGLAFASLTIILLTLATILLWNKMKIN